MPPVFEKLAEQLREPLFRTTESGYDPMDVRSFLDEIAARLAVLEARVAKAEARADKAERRLASARRYVGQGGRGVASPADAGMLDEVVMAGQRRAEELVEAAELEAVRLREEGVARAAAARASTDVPEVRAEVDARRGQVRSIKRSAAAHREGLETVEHAVKAARKEVLDGLERELAELASMPFLLAKEARS